MFPPDFRIGFVKNVLIIDFTVVSSRVQTHPFTHIDEKSFDAVSVSFSGECFISGTNFYGYLIFVIVMDTCQCHLQQRQYVNNE